LAQEFLISPEETISLIVELILDEKIPGKVDMVKGML